MLQSLRLPDMPGRISNLVRDVRGYPVPFFVAWAMGKPDFRVIAPGAFRFCLARRACWVCGQGFCEGEPGVFLIGPMCAVNRISSEPPSHRECAEWAAQACPFLTRPGMRRQCHGLPAGIEDAAGLHDPGNPGLCLTWETRAYRQALVENGILISFGKPLSVGAWTEGRRAEPGELLRAFARGVGRLGAMAREEGREAVELLDRSVRTARRDLSALLRGVEAEALADVG